jgi:hypothetical protein
MASVHPIRPTSPHSCLAKNKTKPLPTDMSPLSRISLFCDRLGLGHSDSDNNEDEEGKGTARGRRGNSKPGDLTAATQELLRRIRAESLKLC